METNFVLSVYLITKLRKKLLQKCDFT